MTFSTGDRVWFEDQPGTVLHYSTSFRDKGWCDIQWDSGQRSMIWATDLSTDEEHAEKEAS
jgi:hypothetical protein